jgi:8-oxo-dGTP pyrophosphatase MutT (NUDIX family)
VNRTTPPPSRPREAAAVILVREARPFEILMVRRVDGSAAGGYWVFPGGRVEPADGRGEDRLTTAALRELAEETGIHRLSAEQLIGVARWITPESLHVRFDTHFFLARAPIGEIPVADGVECVEERWVAPADALRGSMPLLFPTRKQLERMCAFATIDELLEDAARGAVQTVRPRLRSPGDRGEPLLWGDPGYETATG